MENKEFIKGKAFMNFSNNTGPESKNYSTLYIDVDENNQDCIDMLNRVRGDILLAYGYCISQPSKDVSMANDIGMELLNIIDYELTHEDSDYRTKMDHRHDIMDAEYVRNNAIGFMEMIGRNKYNNTWITNDMIEKYTGEELSDYEL